MPTNTQTRYELEPFHKNGYEKLLRSFLPSSMETLPSLCTLEINQETRIWNPGFMISDRAEKQSGIELHYLETEGVPDNGKMVNYVLNTGKSISVKELVRMNKISPGLEEILEDGQVTPVLYGGKVLRIVLFIIPDFEQREYFESKLYMGLVNMVVFLDGLAEKSFIYHGAPYDERESLGIKEWGREPTITLAEFLGNCMKDRNTSMRKIAGAAGISPSYFVLLLNGSRVNPSNEVLEGLAKGLELNKEEEWRLYVSASRLPSGEANEWLNEYITGNNGRGKVLEGLIEGLNLNQLEEIIVNGIVFCTWNGIRTGKIAHYGSQLRGIRQQQLGFTQEQVMKETGIEKAYISHIEREARVPSLNMLRSLANLYGVKRIKSLL